MKLVVISSTDTHIRVKRRLLQLREISNNLQIFFYKRENWYVGAALNWDNIDYLDTIGNGNYILRLKTYIKGYLKIRKYLQNNQNDLVYCFGFDIALKLLFIKDKNFIVEIGDIRIPSGLLKYIVNIVEYLILRKSKGFVVTSEKFIEHYKAKFPNLKINYILAPNKLSPPDNWMRPSFSLRDDKIIHIGYIGKVRYDPIFLLGEIAQNYPLKYCIHFFGEGPLLEPFKIKYMSCDNIKYYGDFDNFKELPEIYSKIDISYVVYDNRKLNVRIAVPNKLYESAYFKKPLIVADQTYLEELVNSMGIGFSINANDPNSVLSLFNKLSKADLKIYYDNLQSIPLESTIFPKEKFLKQIKLINSEGENNE